MQKAVHQQARLGAQIVLLAAACLLAWASASAAQVKSPGPLARAHSTLEGAANCQKCHEAGRKVSAARCLTCHKPIADRMAAKKGVHRDVTGDCEGCHAEHAGVDADLRPLDPASFDHAAEAGFALDGRHAPLTAACARCHTTRSFLAARRDCATCHDDVHKGAAGPMCQDCHTTAGFQAVQPHQHAAGLAPLFVGRHATAACRACHAPVNRASTATGPAARTGGAAAAWTFKGTPTACATCHSGAHEPDLGLACERCHTTGERGFRSGTFSHSSTAFPLTGRHEAVPCRSCHGSRAPGAPAAQAPRQEPTPRDRGPAVPFKGRATACASCHADAHLGQAGTRCETCHTTQSFGVVSYTHAKLPSTFFSGQHAAAGCKACHTRQAESSAAGRSAAISFGGTGAGCASCHQEKDAHRGTLGSDCERCHTPERWPLISRAFHKAGLFPLEGRHLAVPCAGCHINGVTRGTPNTCYDCHWVRRQDDPNQTRLGTQCESCHRPTSWTAITWSHAERTGFSLGATHRTLGCESCHKDRRFLGGAMACSSCHLDEYQKALQPNHAAAGFPATCEVCHQPSHTSWTQAAFRHTSFPLIGAHGAQPCSNCHKANVYAGTPRDCVGCHTTAYQKATNPNHAAAGFPTACDQCHRTTVTTWKGAQFNHASFFALVGTHATQACVTCHANNVFRGTPRDCVGCHLTTYQKTSAPNHAAAGFPTSCAQCHQASSSGWRSGSFNHAGSFTLVGVHATQACTACHKSGTYKGTPRDCVGCHLATYQKTSAPNHAAAGFPTTCEQCHQASSSGWRSGSFNHAGSFALVGVHGTQACTACHKSGTYKGTPRDCVGCHLATYQKTSAPNHAAAGFPTTCEQCHQASASSWGSGSFNHATAFALVGGHATQACTACHKSGTYKGTPRDCVGCHMARYQQTANPNHAAAGFPTTCEQCHQASASSWGSGSFNHATAFALVGGHATQACTACHKSGTYKGTPRDCAGCHMARYQQTANPNHAAAGFPTTCEQCHQASAPGWTSSFNHNQVFPLLGRHLQQPCSACHKNNVYRGTSTACVACHQSTYERTANPNHAAAGFPTTCESCHKAGDSSWNQGVFNHTRFPITSGRHAGVTCATCHTTPNAYQVFSCVSGCHARASIEGEHREVTGFRYDSAACYACHPTGRGGQPRP